MNDQASVRATSSVALYVTTKASLQKLVQQVQNHSRTCKGHLVPHKVQRRGHVGLIQYSCKRPGKMCHKFWWASSPLLPNKRYLVNEKILHGLIFSGMRPSHYTRLGKGAGLGVIESKVRRSFLEAYLPSIEEEYNESIETALQLEVAETLEDPDDWQGIDVCTDARHGHRRNAKDTSMVALGYKTKKVLSHVHITKERDPVTQRHELIGVKDFYNYLETVNTPVRIHVHDRNLSVNSYVKKLGGPTNQNDRWHGIKNLKKGIDSISRGTKKEHGKSWHLDMEDKVEPIGTHAHWAIEHCKGDADTLRRLLAGVVDHYSNIHDKCPATSRCKTDSNYEPSRILLSNSTVKSLLKNAITKSTLYTAAEDFVHGMYTSHVESFNNVMNMFHDKRIYYSDKEYLARSLIAVLYWNENSGREHTSVWQPTGSAGSTRRSAKKKTYKVSTFNYTTNVWKRYYSSLLQ